MQIIIKIGQYEIDFDTTGQIYLRTSKREMFAKSDSRVTWRSHHEVAEPGAGIWSGMGWEITYNRLTDLGIDHSGAT